MSRYWKRRLDRVRYRAKKKGIKFDIDLEDIVEPKKCPLLEVNLKKGDFFYGPSIDRVNPREGYVKGNIRIISRLANMMKNNASANQLLRFCRNIKDYLLFLK